MSSPERFAAMRHALHGAGYAQPVVVVDKPQLLANLKRVSQDLPTGMAVRVVAKSLPSPALLELCCAELGTQRLMTFNLAMLGDIANAMPQADQMLGKPLPVAAAAQFLEAHPKPGRHVHWLVDTPSRLAQYAALAQARKTALNVALELDVGLHRGGFAPGAGFADALTQIAQTPALKLTAVLGYEAHVAKVPTVLGWRGRVFRRGLAQYARAIEQVAEILGPDVSNALIRNAGGSPTFRMYDNTQVVNELALGSVVVKPSDFDTDTLADYAPAAFIATPALKVMPRVQTPVLEALDGPRRLFGRQSAVCIHGGYWKANPVDPPGLRYDSSFGRSSNQEVLVAADNLGLNADDFVFLRPMQSEAVMGQFGEIAVFDGEQISERWPVFPASA